MRLRSVLTSKVYDKAMRLSTRARQQKTVGEVVNLMSVDTQKIGDAMQFFHFGVRFFANNKQIFYNIFSGLVLCKFSLV